MKFPKDKLYSFLFGLGATITVRIVGIFAISDLAAIIFLPFLIFKLNIFSNKILRNIIVLLLFWMFSTIVSDLFNNSKTLDAFKGFFTLVPFLACILLSYWLLNKNFELIIPFLWGYAISYVISAVFGIDAFYSEMVQQKELSSVSQLGQYDKIMTWVIFSFINGAFVITYYKKYPYQVILVMFVFSFIFLLSGSRSIFLQGFIVALVTFFILLLTKDLPWEGAIWQQYLNRKTTSFIVFTVLIVFAAKGSYEFVVSRGYLGEDEVRKYEMEKNSKIGLLAGRGEIISVFFALKDSPLLGHGSYAKDKNGYGYRAAVLAGYDPNLINWYRNYGEKYAIPTHSTLWQAWVFNGLAGGIFWLYIIFGLLFKFLRNYLFEYPYYLAYILSALLMLFWNILFSGFTQKPLLAITIVFFVILIREVDNSYQKYEFQK